MQRKPLSGEQAKARIRARGITITQWAQRHGYSLNAVYRVLNGQLKANFGTAHEIAVALGMKLAEPADESSAGSGAGNTQALAAA